MILQAELVKGVSKNKEVPYIYIKIPLADGYDKVVFLDKAEQALVGITYNEI